MVVMMFFLGFQVSEAQVGINTPTPLSTLDINGNLSLKTIGVPTALNGGPGGSATQISDGVYISLTPLSGSPEFILPNATNVPGRIYILRNISTTVTAQLYSFGGGFYAKDAIVTTAAPLNLPANGNLKTIIIISDGQNWTYIF
ncbi:hypothetical protein SAMN04487935_0869 [Flavobacterium noncentrifugens]|uniref:Uncharacterized protein n=2 Tax=Flavobacterium noncentrifugens TaxID=1128970 RepID=A0A1G8T9Z9_9FLAO|nr:hypothetical protein SAMN04487935_0869 [Flavobacterium noncentrifugens]